MNSSAPSTGIKSCSTCLNSFPLVYLPNGYVRMEGRPCPAHRGPSSSGTNIAAPSSLPPTSNSGPGSNPPPPAPPTGSSTAVNPPASNPPSYSALFATPPSFGPLTLPGEAAELYRQVKDWRTTHNCSVRQALKDCPGVSNSRFYLQHHLAELTICDPERMDALYRSQATWTRTQLQQKAKQLMLTAPVQAKRRAAKRRGELM